MAPNPARPKENAPHEQGIIWIWWPGAESNQGLGRLILLKINIIRII